MKRKIIVLFFTMMLILVMTAKVTANENIPATGEGEAQLLDIDENDIERYFNMYGVAKYNKNNKSINLVNNVGYKVGTTYFSERLSTKYDFEIELVVHMLRVSQAADGLAIGFTESEIGTTGVDGQGFGIVGTKNSVALIIDTHYNENNDNQKNVPNVSLRKTKTSGNFFSEDGTNIGIGTPNTATPINRSDLANKMVPIKMNYNAETNKMTYSFLGKTYTGTLGENSGSTGVALLISSSTGMYKDIVDIYIKRVQAYLVTKNPKKIDFIKNADGSYTFTPINTDNSKYVAGTELYIPGTEKKHIIGSDGSVTISKYDMPKYDVSGGVYIKNPDKGRSAFISIEIPGYQTALPVIKNQAVIPQGSHKITVRKEDGSLYPIGSSVVIDGVTGNYQLDKDGQIEVPRLAFPQFDIGTKISVKQSDKDISEKVDVNMQGRQTNQAIEILQEQDYYGNVKLKFFKDVTNSYPLGTEVILSNLGTFIIDSNGEITISYDKLQEQAFTQKYKIKENDKEESIEKEYRLVGVNDSQRKQIEKELNSKINELKEYISGLENLDDQRKVELQEDLNQILTTKIGKLDETKTIEEGNQVKSDLNTKLSIKKNEIDLEDYKNKSIKELEEYKNVLNDKVEKLALISQSEKESYETKLLDKFNELKTMIINESTQNAVDTKKQFGISELNKIYLEALKDNSRIELTTLFEDTKTKISNLIEDPDERNKIFNTINNIQTNVNKDLDEAQTEIRILDILEQTRKDLNNLVSDALETDTEASILKYTTDLSERAEQLKQAIEILGKLKNSEKKAYKDLIEGYLTDGITEFKTATSASDVRTIYSAKILKMQEVVSNAKLENHKYEALDELNDLYAGIIGEITAEKDLSPTERSDYDKQLNTILSDVKEKIEESLTPLSVNDHKKNATDEMNKILLKAHKKAAINEINSEKNRISNMLDELIHLSKTEKENYMNEINAFLVIETEKIDSIDEKYTIDQIVINAIEKMNDKSSSLIKLNEKRQKTLDLIDEAYTKAKNILDNEKVLQEDYKEALYPLLDNEKEKAYKAIAENNLEDIDAAVEEPLRIMNELEAAIKLQILYDQMKLEETKTKDLIDALTNVAEEKRNEVKKKLEDKTMEIAGIIYYNHDEETRMKAYNEAIEYYHDEYEKLKQLHEAKADAKDNIKNYVEEKIGFGEITNDLSEIVKTIENQIDSATTVQEVEEILRNGKEQINNHLESEVGNKKDRVKTELTEYATKPIGDKVQEIIEQQKNKINESNYSNEETVSRTIDEGKYLIKEEELKQVKDAAKEELESSAKNPNDEAVKKIIEEELEKIIETNYSNQNAVSKIIEDAKNKIKEQELNDLKDKVKKELEDLVTKPIIDEIKDIIDTHLEKITEDNYKNDEVIQEIVDNAKKEVLEKQKEEIEKAKDKVREELERNNKNPKDKDIIDKYIDQINKDNYNDLDALNKIIESANKEIKDNADKKEQARNELNDKYNELINSGKYNDKGLEELRKIYNDALDGINNSITGDEAKNIKDTAIKALNNVARNNSYEWLLITLLAIIVIELSVIIVKKRKGETI